MKTTSQFSKIGSDCQVLKIFFYEVIFLVDQHKNRKRWMFLSIF